VKVKLSGYVEPELVKRFRVVLLAWSVKDREQTPRVSKWSESELVGLFIAHGISQALEELKSDPAFKGLDLEMDPEGAMAALEKRFTAATSKTAKSKAVK
jgi:hypothetical protein